MREPERDLGRLYDIIEAANHIASFTEGYSHEELRVDKLRYFAVVKNVEIIGEAAYMHFLLTRILTKSRRFKTFYNYFSSYISASIKNIQRLHKHTRPCNQSFKIVFLKNFNLLRLFCIFAVF